MNPKSFFGELKRRNVYKVAIAYAVVGWLLTQVATQVFPFFEIPNWGIRLVEEYQKAQVLNDDPLVLGLLARAYASSGNTTGAEKILNQLNELSKVRYVSAYSFALVYLGLGNKEESLRWLEESYQDHTGDDLAYLKVEPLLDPLRGDPRFEALVQKVFAPKKVVTDSRQSSP
jgi:hypothetical protein